MGHPPAFGPPHPQQYAAPQVPAPDTGPPAASIGARIGAYAIDCVITLILTVALFVGAGVGGVITVSQAGMESLAPLVLLLDAVLIVTVNFCYFWLPTARSGKTLGKRILKIRVVDPATGHSPSAGKAAGRTALMFLLNLLSFGAVLNLVLTVIDDPQQRSLHDRATTTRVVPA